MSEKAATAQKWAEAKDALEAAQAVMTAAQEMYVTTLEAEREAWLAMAALAGRLQPEGMTVEIVKPAEYQKTAVFRDAQSTLPNSYRHSLPVKPLG